MTKGIQKNTVKALWHRVILDEQIYKIAIKFRTELGMPIMGFTSSDDFETWHKKIIRNKKEQSRIKTTHKFINESKKIIPYKGVISELNFREILIEFFYFNDVEEKHLDEMKDSDMGVSIIKNNKQFLSATEKIEDGVYIKVGTFSRISNLMEYISNHEKLIKGALELYVSSQKLIKPEKIGSSSNFERDKMIIDLNHYTLKKIKETFKVRNMYFETELGMDKYKAISLVLNYVGYEKVTPSIVETVIQRGKIKSDFR